MLAHFSAYSFVCLFNICLYVFTSSLRLFVCISATLSGYLSICPNICLSAHFSLHMSVHFSPLLSSIYMSTCLSIRLSAFLSVCLFICLPVFPLVSIQTYKELFKYTPQNKESISISDLNLATHIFLLVYYKVQQ